jgi:hypothetical protein
MAKEDGRVAKVLSAISMREITVLTRKMVLVFLPGQVVTYTKENTRTTKETAMERWNGLMEAFTKVNGRRVYSMAMERCCSLMGA